MSTCKMAACTFLITCFQTLFGMKNYLQPLKQGAQLNFPGFRTMQVHRKIKGRTNIQSTLRDLNKTITILPDQYFSPEVRYLIRRLALSVRFRSRKQIEPVETYIGEVA